MRLSTLIRCVSGVLVVLLSMTVLVNYLLYVSHEEELQAMDRRQELKQLGIDLANASDYLTNQAREYVQFGEKVHFDNYWREVNETKTRDRVVKRLQELNAPQEELDLIEKAKQNSDALVQTEEAAMKAVEAKDFETARRLMFDVQYEANKMIIMEPINEFQNKMNERAKREAVAASERTVLMINLITIAVVVVMITAVITFYLLIKRMKPLTELTAVANRISKGDLTVDAVEVKSQDEVSVLAHAINGMVDNLRELIQKINSASLQVASSSQALLASAESTSQTTEGAAMTIQELASGSEAQVRSSEESLVSMEEMAQGIQRIAATSALVSEASLESATEAEQGNRSIRLAIQQMNAINVSTHNTQDVIATLDNRSKEIGQIVGVITGIAAQTNLLALNAAIEAARAGEHGRGFAVVADEVRKLAEQSEISAGQITALIEEMQADASKAVETMAVGASEVGSGLRVVNEAGDAFQKIVVSARHVSEQIQEISAATEELSAGSEEVTASVDELTTIAKNSFSQSQQVAEASEQQLAVIQDITASVATLSQIAQELQETVSRFKVKSH